MYVMLNEPEKNKAKWICIAVKTDVIFMVNATTDLTCSHAKNGTNNSVLCDICDERNTVFSMLTCNKWK